MSEEPRLVSFQPGEGKPGESVTKDAGEQTEQPSYLTRKEAETLMREIADQAADGAYRRAQSLIDKTDNRLTKQVQDRFEQLKTARAQMAAAGQPVSDEAFDDLLEAERLKILSSVGDQGIPPAAGIEQREVDAINREAQRIMEELGVEVEEEDPEAEYINFQSTPEVFLETLKVAAKMKAKRLTDSGEKVEPVAPEARIPSLGASGKQSNPIADITDPDTLIQMGLKGQKR